MSRRLDRRLVAIPLAIIVIAVGGYVVNVAQHDAKDASTGSQGMVAAHAMMDDAKARRAHQSFQQAVAMLQAGEFEFALTALHDVLAVYPALPEAHVNMGFALLGLGDTEAAADFFNSATDIRPTLHNAYYGLGLAERENGNEQAALAAMQAFAHLATENDQYLPRAQAIIWALQAETREASR